MIIRGTLLKAGVSGLRLFPLSSLVATLGSQIRPQIREQVRLASKKSKGQDDSSANRHAVLRKQAKLDRKKDLIKKLEKERKDAKITKITPVLMQTDYAIRYLKAAEVGQPEFNSTIAVTLKSVPPLHFQQIRASVRLPKKVQTDRVAVFTTQEDLIPKLLEVGATYAGADELIEKVKKNEVEFEKCFATPDALHLLRPVQKILGPKGLMPSERRGTVSEDVIELVDSSQGLLDFLIKDRILTVNIGNTMFTSEEIKSNIGAVMKAYRDAIVKNGSRQIPILSEVILSSTHGPGVMILA
ncbi:ribosomal protein L1-like protein [Dipodascopsis uninucleata]